MTAIAWYVLIQNLQNDRDWTQIQFLNGVNQI